MDQQGIFQQVYDPVARVLKVSTSAVVPDVSATGTISGNTAVTLALTGQASVTIQDVNAGFTGTLNFEGSDDGGTTWFALAVWPVGSTASGNLITSAATTTETANHLWEGNVAALSNVRVRGSSVSAGTAAIVIRAGLSTSAVVLDGPIPTGTNSIGTVKPATSVYPNAAAAVTSANADTALAAANANRTGLIVSNDSTAKLYVLVDPGGATAASATTYTYVVQAGGTLELPIVGGSVPTARIRGFWSAANGTAAVTDIS